MNRPLENSEYPTVEILFKLQTNKNSFQNVSHSNYLPCFYLKIKNCYASRNLLVAQKAFSFLKATTKHNPIRFDGFSQATILEKTSSCFN